MPHPIENILQTTMEELRKIADVSTVVGAPIMMSGDTVLMPVSRITLGFLSGGGEYTQKDAPVRQCGGALDAGGQTDGYPFIGASAAGVSMRPSAFLAVQDGHITVMPAESGCTADRVIDRLPQIIAEAERLLTKLLQKDGRSEGMGSGSAGSAAVPSGERPE